MTGLQIIGWAAVGFIVLMLAVLGALAVWATYKYIRDNHNIGGK